MRPSALLRPRPLAKPGWIRYGGIDVPIDTLRLFKSLERIGRRVSGWPEMERWARLAAVRRRDWYNPDDVVLTVKKVLWPVELMRRSQLTKERQRPPVDSQLP